MWSDVYLSRDIIVALLLVRATTYPEVGNHPSLMPNNVNVVWPFRLLQGSLQLLDYLESQLFRDDPHAQLPYADKLPQNRLLPAWPRAELSILCLSQKFKCADYQILKIGYSLNLGIPAST